MNKEDFERLKAVCEKEGFELLRTIPDKNTSFHVLAVSKKDIWEGVEFVECVNSEYPESWTVGKIYKLYAAPCEILLIKDNKNQSSSVIEYDSVRFPHHNCFKPSTESAYIEQLKKEFEDRGIRKFKIRNTDISMMDGGCLKDPLPEFIYRKDTDTLYFHGVPVYQQGKWATRMKERVEVEFGWTEKKIALMKTPVALFTNKSTEKSIFDGKTSNEICDIFTFLAKQLEKYLNGEVE